MLEIDSRSGTRGLELFQDDVYESLVVISNVLVRVVTPYTQPNQELWALLSADERASLEKLSGLSKAILTYYVEANKARE
jgi:hypothetical protein